jgi:hypothetical protein
LDHELLMELKLLHPDGIGNFDLENPILQPGRFGGFGHPFSHDFFPGPDEPILPDFWNQAGPLNVGTKDPPQRDRGFLPASFPESHSLNLGPFFPGWGCAIRREFESPRESPMNSQKNWFFWKDLHGQNPLLAPSIRGVGPLGPREQSPPRRAEAPSAMRASPLTGLIAQVGQLIRGRTQDTNFLPSTPLSLDDLDP